MHFFNHKPHERHEIAVCPLPYVRAGSCWFVVEYIKKYLFRNKCLGFLLVLLLFSFFSCSRQKPQEDDLAEAIARFGSAIGDHSGFLPDVFLATGLPGELSGKIQEELATSPAFIMELLSIMETDPYLRLLVDKRHGLEKSYEPEDLVVLADGQYRVGRSGLMLRKDAAAALEEMASAAGADGLTLVASSAYRSYDYQAQVYSRHVREMGQEEADRVSARPGHSQHQLGLVLDFGSIDDSFAKTSEGIWIAANASRFGWSLSYPQGLEAITGYSWESWHYRYVGKDLAAFIDNYFDGIQQYALRFIYEWENQAAD